MLVDILDANTFEIIAAGKWLDDLIPVARADYWQARRELREHRRYWAVLESSDRLVYLRPAADTE